jgi:hypothetical protein
MLVPREWVAVNCCGRDEKERVRREDRCAEPVGDEGVAAGVSNEITAMTTNSAPARTSKGPRRLSNAPGLRPTRNDRRRCPAWKRQLRVAHNGGDASDPAMNTNAVSERSVASTMRSSVSTEILQFRSADAAPLWASSRYATSWARTSTACSQQLDRVSNVCGRRTDCRARASCACQGVRFCIGRSLGRSGR